MPSYTIAQNNSLSAAHGTIARVATSAGVGAAVIGWYATDEEVAASVRRLTLERTTGGVVGTAQTPERLRAESRAADAGGAIDFSTEPTLVGNPLVRLAYQNVATNGSLNYRHWRAHPRYPPLVPASDFMTLRGTNLAIPVSRVVWLTEPDETPQRPIRGARPRRPGYWFHQDYSRGTTATTANPTRPTCGPAFHMVEAATWAIPAGPVNLAALIDSLGGGALFTLDVAGALTDAGALTLQGNKALAGTLTDGGALTKLALKALAGALTDAGALAKRANKVLAGALTTAGTLANSKLASVALAGALTSAGALARRANKALAGTPTSAGALAKRVGKPLAGGLATAGTRARQVNRALAGALAAGGGLANAYQQAVAIGAGAARAAGLVATQLRAAGAGVASYVGGLVSGRSTTGGKRG